MQAGMFIVHGLGTYGYNETQIVKSRRAKIIDQAANIGDRRLRLTNELLQQSHGLRRFRWNDIMRRFGFHDDGGERWSQAIVQIAAQAPALLFSGRDQMLARALHIPCQALQDGAEPHRVSIDSSSYVRVVTNA